LSARFAEQPRADTFAADPEGAAQRRAQAGFSLAEVLVSIMLVSAIGIAGLALLDSLAGVQRRLDGRYQTLSELDLFFSAATMGLTEADPDSLILSAGVLSFDTQGCAGRTEVRIRLSENALTSRAQGCPGMTAEVVGVRRLDIQIVRSDRSEFASWPVEENPDLVASGVLIALDFQPEPGLPEGTVWKLVELYKAPER
jgi:general secretion pathway protein J